MCRSPIGPARGGLALILALALTVPAPASTQQTREERLEQLRSELAEIDVRLRAAEERAQSFIARTTARTEANVEEKTATVNVGPLRIAAEPDRVDEARAMFAPVWAELAWAGAEGVDFSDVVFVYDPAGRLGGVRFVDRIQRIAGRQWRSLDVDPDAVRRSIRHAIGREIAGAYPSDVKAWAGGLGPVPTPESALSRLYRDLALAPAKGAGECFETGGEACWVALGLGGGPSAYTRWYDIEEVRSAYEESRSLLEEGRVREAAARRPRLGIRGGLERCIPEPEFCGDFNTTPPWWQGAIPLPASLRADFTAFAVTLGGEGAIERFMAELPRPGRVGGARVPVTYVEFSTGLKRAILAASRMDEDELMSRWRERILARRPDQTVGAKRSRAASLAWILFFAAFATRSSRWRLG